jgi:hypothetical protein
MSESTRDYRHISNVLICHALGSLFSGHYKIESILVLLQTILFYVVHKL